MNRILFYGATKYLVLFIFIHFIACNGRVNTEPKNNADSSVAETNEISEAHPDINTNQDDPNFVATKDTISKYGPGSITRNVLQDRNGIFWFATWEGIISYSDKVFTNHTLKEGLRRFHVFSILEDKSGNIWFGMIGGGVYRYDPNSKGRGQAFTLFTSKDGLPDDVILCIQQDNAGNIWFGTNNGVSRYEAASSNSSGGRFFNYTIRDGLSANQVYSITQDRKGNLWFGTQGGVNYFNSSAGLLPGGKSFTNFNNSEGSNFANVRSIVEDRAGNIWISSQDGLCRYNPNASPGESQQTIISTNFTGFIYEDKKGDLWLSEATADGSSMSLTRLGVGGSPRFEKIISKVQVFGITEDRDGNIWFGTVNGVCRYNTSAATSTGDKSFTCFSEKEFIPFSN